MGGGAWWGGRWQGLVRVRGLLEDGALRGERHRALLQIAQALWDARNTPALIRRCWGVCEHVHLTLPQSGGFSRQQWYRRQKETTLPLEKSVPHVSTSDSASPPP
ncbi:unnamed protein product, partial [Ectocarpus sp. 8 AP-2014]